MSIKEITIIIASFKSEKVLNNCLNSIDRECPVIVVENSNDEKIKKKLKTVFQILNVS